MINASSRNKGEPLSLPIPATFGSVHNNKSRPRGWRGGNATYDNLGEGDAFLSMPRDEKKTYGLQPETEERNI